MSDNTNKNTNFKKGKDPPKKKKNRINPDKMAGAVASICKILAALKTQQERDTALRMSASFFNLQTGIPARGEPMKRETSASGPMTSRQAAAQAAPPAKEKPKGPSAVPSSHPKAIATILREKRKVVASMSSLCKKIKEGKSQEAILTEGRLPESHELVKKLKEISKRLEDSYLTERTKALQLDSDAKSGPTTTAKKSSRRDRSVEDKSPNTTQIKKPKTDTTDSKSADSAMDADQEGEDAIVQPTWNVFGVNNFITKLNSERWEACHGKKAEYREFSIPLKGRKSILGAKKHLRACGDRSDVAAYDPESGAIFLVSKDGSYYTREQYSKIKKDERGSLGLPRKWRLWVFNPEDPYWHVSPPVETPGTSV